MSAPWLKFYPSDWRADPALRMCSIGARGLWMEMLCIMHEAEPYGSLRVNGRPVSDRQMAGLAGASPAEVEPWLAELEGAGVFSRDEDGAIVSRRMMRDKAKAEADKDNGRRGGNPKLTKGVNPSVGEGDKAQKPEARDQNPDQEKIVPNGTTPEAGAPVMDAKDWLWADGPVALESFGLQAKRVRPIIGKWLRDAGDDAELVLTTIQRAEQQRIVDPVPWITQAIAKSTGPPGPRRMSPPTIDQHGNPIHDQRPRSARAQYTDAFAAGLAEAERALNR